MARGVKVVGEDRSGAPGANSGCSLQAGAAQSVAALEVAGPALGAGAVSGEPSLCSSGAWLLAASDENPLGREPLELACCVGQELALGRVARLGGRRQDESACSAPGVCCHTRVLRAGCVLSPRRSAA